MSDELSRLDNAINTKLSELRRLLLGATVSRSHLAVTLRALEAEKFDCPEIAIAAWRELAVVRADCQRFASLYETLRALKEARDEIE